MRFTTYVFVIGTLLATACKENKEEFVSGKNGTRSSQGQANSQDAEGADTAGKKDQTSMSEEETSGSQDSVQGTWKSGCITALSLADKSQPGFITAIGSSIYEFKMTSTQAALTIWYYTDNDCEVDGTANVDTMTYKLGESNNGQTIIDFQEKSYQTIPSAETAPTFNEQSLCGHRDWKAGVPIDVTGCGVGRKSIHDVIKWDGSTLYLGIETLRTGITKPNPTLEKRVPLRKK